MIFLHHYSSDDSNRMRKPNPGMIYLARKKYRIKLKIFVVGILQRYFSWSKS